MSEPFLSKIQTLIDAKLLRNFAIGSRAKIFRGLKLLKPLQFLPARQKFFTKFFAPSFINHLKTYNLLIKTDF